MKVLITGAAGNLGEKLRTHLESNGDYVLTLLDRRAGDTASVIPADLGIYDESWVRCFSGQDVVVHLAATASPWASWESLQHNNIDAVLNVFRAAVEHRVSRVVLASSSRAFLGYRDRRLLIRHDCVPKPVEFYGAAKIFAERLGKSYADQYGLSVICLRIGAIWPGENSPEGKKYAQQLRWLSTRDFCQATEKAIRVPNVGFAALFVISDNIGNRLDLSETRRVLGYEPQDGIAPVRPPLPARIMATASLRLRRIRRRLLSHGDSRNYHGNHSSRWEGGNDKASSNVSQR